MALPRFHNLELPSIGKKETFKGIPNFNIKNKNLSEDLLPKPGDINFQQVSKNNFQLDFVKNLFSV